MSSPPRVGDSSRLSTTIRSVLDKGKRKLLSPTKSSTKRISREKENPVSGPSGIPRPSTAFSGRASTSRLIELNPQLAGIRINALSISAARIKLSRHLDGLKKMLSTSSDAGFRRQVSKWVEHHNDHILELQNVIEELTLSVSAIPDLPSMEASKLQRDQVSMDPKIPLEQLFGSTFEAANTEDEYPEMDFPEIAEEVKSESPETPPVTINPNSLIVPDSVSQFINLVSSSPIPSPLNQPAIPIPTIVNTSQYIEAIVFGKFQELHNSNPDYPLFQPLADGRIQLPLTALNGRNGSSVCWQSKCVLLAKAGAKRMGPSLQVGACWMVRQHEITVQRKRANGAMAMVFSCQAARLLAFLNLPTDDNWDRLTGELYRKPGWNSNDWPFCHYCHNGYASLATRRGDSCVNGIQHGHFGSVQFNAQQRGCKFGEYRACPGHDFNGEIRKCIYVHRDGTLKPCLNSRDGRPPNCPHETKCFE